MFYSLKPACNTKETGPEYPQAQSMSIEYDLDAHDSIRALSKHRDSFPDFLPNLDSFRLHNKAKFTDLISSSLTISMTGMLISEKLKKIITEHNAATHKFYPATIISQKEKREDYYWMHIISNLVDCVDFNKSIFYIEKDYALNLGKIDISSKEDLQQKREQLKKNNPSHTVTIWAEKIVCNEKFDAKLDLFKIGTFDSDYYISKKLMDAISQ